MFTNLLCAVVLSQAPAPVPVISVVLDGRPVKFESVQPRIVTGRVLVPMRGIFEQMGAFLEYDPVEHKVRARKDSEEMDVTIGERLAHKDGAEILLDTRPMIYKGVTLVPLRFIAEALGAKVTWDNAHSTVNIVTKEEKDDDNG